MSEPTPRFWEIFFALFEGLPRQGPGNRACTARALGSCRDLPQAAAVLDLGCGVGAQTLDLAELMPGVIVAADTHAPSVERLRRTAAESGLSQRVRPVVADMAHPPLRPASLDLIWSEGALYNIGIEPALRICRPLLRSGGYLVFTDAVWRTHEPPPEVTSSFEDYPTMGAVSDVIAAIERAGLSLVAHFTLPDEAWWDDFYTPMERRIEELRATYVGDSEALAILNEIAQEPEMHRRHSNSYAYEFFVTRYEPRERASHRLTPTACSESLQERHDEVARRSVADVLDLVDSRLMPVRIAL